MQTAKEPLTVWKPNIAGYTVHRWNSKGWVTSYFYAYVGKTKLSASGCSKHRPVRCLGQLEFCGNLMKERLIPNASYWELADKLPRKYF